MSYSSMCESTLPSRGYSTRVCVIYSIIINRYCGNDKSITDNKCLCQAELAPGNVIIVSLSSGDCSCAKIQLLRLKKVITCKWTDYHYGLIVDWVAVLNKSVRNMPAYLKIYIAAFLIVVHWECISHIFDTARIKFFISNIGFLLFSGSSHSKGSNVVDVQNVGNQVCPKIIVPDQALWSTE